MYRPCAAGAASCEDVENAPRVLIGFVNFEEEEEEEEEENSAARGEEDEESSTVRKKIPFEHCLRPT